MEDIGGKTKGHQIMPFLSLLSVFIPLCEEKKKFVKQAIPYGTAKNNKGS